jgi:hypothetical protein
MLRALTVGGGVVGAAAGPIFWVPYGPKKEVDVLSFWWIHHHLQVLNKFCTT